MKLEITRRPIVLETQASGALIAATLARIEAAVGRASLYGVTDPVEAKLFASESIEADFVAGSYRNGFTTSPSVGVLPGWAFARTGSGTAPTANGSVASFATGEPRITSRGLTIESASTNLLPYSRDLTNAAWTKRGAVSVTATSALRPDGTTGANLVQGLGAEGVNDLFQAVGTDGSGFATPSFHFKKVSSTGTIILTNPAGFGGGAWAIDLSLLSTGWERINEDHPAVSVANPFIVLGATIGVLAYAGAGGPLSFYIDFVQQELRAKTTTPIVTTSAAAARGKDAASFSVDLADEGGVFVDFHLPTTSGFTNVVFAASDGAGNQIVLYRLGNDVLVAEIGSRYRELGTFADADMRVFVGWKSGMAYLAVNGAEVTGGSYVGGLEPSILRLGQSATEDFQLNSHIRRVLVTPRLPSAEAQLFMTEL